MQFELPARRRRRLISLTPLIDVVFILLLFFMLASRLTQLYAVPIEAPGRAAPDAPSEPALLLRIGNDGSLDLNGEPVAADALGAELADWRARTPQLRVVVQPQDRVPLQTSLRVLDTLAAAGVPIVRLQ